MIVALQRVARRAVRGPIQGAVAVAAFAAVFFFEASLLVVMLMPLRWESPLQRCGPALSAALRAVAASYWALNTYPAKSDRAPIAEFSSASREQQSGDDLVPTEGWGDRSQNRLHDVRIIGNT